MEAAAALRAPTLPRPPPLHRHVQPERPSGAPPRQPLSMPPQLALLPSAGMLEGGRLVAQSGVHCGVDLDAHLQTGDGRGQANVVGHGQLAHDGAPVWHECSTAQHCH